MAPVLCQCGCGLPAPISKWTNVARGAVAGEPCRFRTGHSGTRKGRYVGKDGYVRILKPEHPRASKQGHVLEHVLVAEAALGHLLPDGAVVHHAGEKHENVGGKLALLQDQHEHLSLHRRLRVLRAGGNPFTDFLCTYCRKPQPRKEFSELKNGTVHGVCRTCNRESKRVKPENRKRSWARRKAVA